MKRFSIIYFDGDNTLWDFEKVMRNSLRIALNKLREHHKDERAESLTIDDMIAIRNEVADSYGGTATKLEHIRLEAFSETCSRVGVTDASFPAVLNELYLSHRFDDIELYDDVLLPFDALAKSYPLGLLSNGNGYPERQGLAERFAHVVFSQDHGVGKPSPEIFEIAAKQAQCGCEQIMHIGDKLTDDVQGANNVGATSVWLNREGDSNATGIKPDYEVRKLTELLDIVAL